jgi:hypothetical protein
MDPRDRHSSSEGVSERVSEGVRTCVVGYALNKKKLRKSGSTTSLPHTLTTSLPHSSTTNTSSNESLSSDKSSGVVVVSGGVSGGVSGSGSSSGVTVAVTPSHTHSHTPSHVWKGGGLADLLSDKDDTDVRFVPVDFDLPLHEQPEYHVILHKLTEDIRVCVSDEEAQGKLTMLSDYLRYVAWIYIPV